MSDEIKLDFVNFGRKRNQQREEPKIKRGTPHSHMKPSTKAKCKEKLSPAALSDYEERDKQLVNKIY